LKSEYQDCWELDSFEGNIQIYGALNMQNPGAGSAAAEVLFNDPRPADHLSYETAVK